MKSIFAPKRQLGQIKMSTDKAGSIAVITMVRDDEMFLTRWIRYYSSIFGKKNLYVIVHGDNAEIERLASGCSLVKIPTRGRRDTVGQAFYNGDRADLVEGLTAGLLKYHKFVIYTDVDEFVVLDPSVGPNIVDFINRCDEGTVLSPFGLEVVHLRGEETESIASGDRVLAMRRYCRIAPRYTKPIIVGKPVRWSGGFHHSTHPKLNVPQGLYCFHLKWMDYKNSICTHYARAMNKLDSAVPAEGEVPVDQLQFPLRAAVEAVFSEAENRPRTENFEFDDAILFYVKTWRMRTYLLQKDYWMSLIGDGDSRYIKYWRFSDYMENRLYKIPERFALLPI